MTVAGVIGARGAARRGARLTALGLLVVALAGLAMVTHMAGGSLPRALLMAAFGLLFGCIGYVLRRHGYDLGIVILAFVLGPIFERPVRQALAISDGDPLVFVHSPLAAGFAITAVLILLAGLWPRRLAQRA
ncbi:MAG: hypothetical protein QM674_09045 [Burkholderiaceae bacterium]